MLLLSMAKSVIEPLGDGISEELVICISTGKHSSYLNRELAKVLTRQVVVHVAAAAATTDEVDPWMAPEVAVILWVLATVGLTKIDLWVSPAGIVN